MQCDVELSGGPLAGCRWPVRLEADRTLWIGIGADGGEYDGRSRLKGIAIYERAGDAETPRFDFLRLEGPGARIAELGRRITRLRTTWAAGRRAVSSAAAGSGKRAPAEGPTAAAVGMTPEDAARIARSVLERWLRALESSRSPPESAQDKVRINLIVPGEAEQFRDLLETNGIAAEVIRRTIEVRVADRAEPESLEAGVVQIQSTDVYRVMEMLRMSGPV